MDDLVERLLRWADSDDDTILGKRKPDPTCLKRQAAARIQALETALAEAEGRVEKMERALGNIRALATKHQAVCGPDGNWAHVEGFAATALETGEWKK